MTKKSTVFFNVLLLSSLGMSAGCSKTPVNSKPKLTSSAAALLVEQGKTIEAAEMYSRIGEILLSKPEGITHAEAMFKKSIELNSNNDKANLYSAVISPVLTARGFSPRFKTLIPEVAQLEQKFVNYGVKEVIDFALVMPEGKKAAKKYEDIRKFYRDELARELGNSIVKLENIKSDKFSLELNVTSKSSKEACVALEDGSFDCEMQEEAIKNKSVKRNLDAYDIKAIKGILKTEKNALTIAYSFGLEGAEEIDEALNKDGTKKTDKEVITAIKTQPKFLKIDGSKDDLRQIFDHSEEVLNDLLDFSKLSKTLCGNDERSSNVASDICVTEEAAEKISEILMFVAGPKSVLLGLDENGQEVTVEVDLRSLLNSNVSSLQELLPTKFDSQGKIAELKDLTFMGVIPNADLIAKLKTVVK